MSITKKTTREWELELEDGTPFCLYDWKEYRYYDDDEEVIFHIGTITKEESEKVLKVLTEDYGLKKATW